MPLGVDGGFQVHSCVRYDWDSNVDLSSVSYGFCIGMLCSSVFWFNACSLDHERNVIISGTVRITVLDLFYQFQTWNWKNRLIFWRVGSRNRLVSRIFQPVLSGFYKLSASLFFSWHFYVCFYFFGHFFISFLNHFFILHFMIGFSKFMNILQTTIFSKLLAFLKFQ